MTKEEIEKIVDEVVKALEKKKDFPAMPYSPPEYPNNPYKPWKRDCCNHPEHHPPGHKVFPPQGYTHVCPGCGQRTFIKSSVTWM